MSVWQDLVCRVFSILKKSLGNFLIVIEMRRSSQQQTSLKHEDFDEFVDLEVSSDLSIRTGNNHHFRV
jgi:hypothetical protein